MRVNITGSDPDQGIGVEVFDERENRHWLAIDWDGTVRGHENDDYPQEPDERTDDEARIICQVRERACYEAQREFPEEDILPPSWNPDELVRGLVALESFPLDRFREEFRTCHRMVTEPTSFVDVPLSDVGVIWQPFAIDENDSITTVPKPALQYVEDEDPALYGALDTNDIPGTVIDISVPPQRFRDGAFEFPDGFQVFLARHIAAKVRDCYYHMGEQPPAVYDQIDGPGLLTTCADGPIDFEAQERR